MHEHSFFFYYFGNTLNEIRIFTRNSIPRYLNIMCRICFIIIIIHKSLLHPQRGYIHNHAPIDWIVYIDSDWTHLHRSYHPCLDESKQVPYHHSL